MLDLQKELCCGDSDHLKTIWGVKEGFWEVLLHFLHVEGPNVL